MKEFKKMTKLQLLVFFLMAICSGTAIGIGATASLLANNLYGTWGKLIGAFLFSIGIYAIVAYDMKLFTGMVASMPKMGFKNYSFRLPICFLGNIIGVGAIAFLVYFSPVADKVVPQAISLVNTKLHVNHWAIRALCSSILCGALITISVWSAKYAPKKGLSSSLGVLFPIVVFAFCGFDHSVANMMYFYYLGDFCWHVVAYILITILGNIIGGLILPLAAVVRDYSEQQKK